MLFYHDHTMGINRLNIYAGLQGLYFIRDEAEDALNFPRENARYRCWCTIAFFFPTVSSNIPCPRSQMRRGYLKSSATPSW